MFFYLPIGHDQPFYERPWLTLSLIAACTVMLGITTFMEVRVERELTVAVADMEMVLAEHPGARVSFTIEGLPEDLQPLIAPLIDATPGRHLTEGDLALEASLRRVLSVLNDAPALRFGFRPAHPDVGRAFAHMFVHGGFFHLLGNMLLLWVAGGVLECFWRRWAYVVLYFGSGFAGVLSHALSDPHGLTPVIGASGAVSGLLGAFLVGYPRTKIKIFYAGWFFRPFFGTTDRAAWVVLPLWAGVEILSAVISSGSGVAHWAHVGGFTCGALVALVARQMKWVAEDAGISRVAKIVEHEMPQRSPTLVKAFARDAIAELPLPEPHAPELVAGGSEPPDAARVVPAPNRPLSGRPAPEAIELSSLPPVRDDDPFQR